MTIATRSVMVRQLPERLDRVEERAFARDLHTILIPIVHVWSSTVQTFARWTDLRCNCCSTLLNRP